MPDAVPGSFTTINQHIADVLRSNVSVTESGNRIIAPMQASAIWDTGAMCTVISNELAVKLCLQTVSVRMISTPSGTMDANLYVIDLFLPNSIKVERVQALGAYPSGCDVLIGMDVIGLGDFAVTNFLGQTAFSFRIPSISRIDFTE